jgi:dipeptidyl aminopeptidase/acylaminoacyl peptidase
MFTKLHRSKPLPKKSSRQQPNSNLHGWSPDGKRLAYCAERGGQYDIYTISVNGGQETQLTNLPGLDDGPEYSPDGRTIWFNSTRTGLMQIWRMEMDGSNPMSKCRHCRVGMRGKGSLSLLRRRALPYSYEQNQRQHPGSRLSVPGDVDLFPARHRGQMDWRRLFCLGNRHDLKELVQ